MTILNSENSLIMIIDIQDRLLNAVFNKELLVKKAVTIAKTARILNIPVVVTEQYPKGLGATVMDLKAALGENTKYFEKTAFSALDNPEISATIKAFARKQVLIFGIETHICVSQTANALKEADYEVYTVVDACGSRCEAEHNAGLNRMQDNGARSLTTEIAMFEWLKSSKHPDFKEIQSLIK